MGIIGTPGASMPIRSRAWQIGQVLAKHGLEGLWPLFAVINLVGECVVLVISEHAESGVSRGLLVVRGTTSRPAASIHCKLLITNDHTVHTQCGSWRKVTTYSLPVLLSIEEVWLDGIVEDG